MNPDEKIWRKPEPIHWAVVPYHPGAVYEMRSQPQDNRAGQQCCFDENFNLLTKIPAAGTADKISPLLDFWGHQEEDVDTFHWARLVDDNAQRLWQQWYRTEYINDESVKDLWHQFLELFGIQGYSWTNTCKHLYYEVRPPDDGFCRLNVTIDPTGSGSVTVTPSGTEFPCKTELTLAAKPNTGYYFAGWGSRRDRPVEPSLSKSMDWYDVTVYACFTKNPTLSIAVNGAGSTKPAVGTHSYDWGAPVTVEAQPASGWRLDHWDGHASGGSPTITITMDADKQVTAYFKKTFKLSISPYPKTVIARFSLSPRPHLNPPRMPCGSGTYIYDEGTRVTITALEDIRTGWIFDHWEGALTGNTNPVTITMNSDEGVIAYYKQAPVAYPPPPPPIVK